MVRNPRTGERKRAKATAVPRFHARGQDLKAPTSPAPEGAAGDEPPRRRLPLGLPRHPKSAVAAPEDGCEGSCQQNWDATAKKTAAKR